MAHQESVGRMETRLFVPTLGGGCMVMRCVVLETPWWRRMCGMIRIAYEDLDKVWRLGYSTKNELF